MKNTFTLPKYFDVDGTLVKLEKDLKTGEVISNSDYGTPFPIIKAMEEGIEISETEFNKLKNNRSGKNLIYPRYFEIKGKVVKVEINKVNNLVEAHTTDGVEISLGSLKEGRELTRVEYEGLNKILYPKH